MKWIWAGLGSVANFAHVYQFETRSLRLLPIYYSIYYSILFDNKTDIECGGNSRAS